MPRLDKLAFSLVAAFLAIPEMAAAQSSGPSGAANVWTFSTDSSNNLVVQDLASLNTAPASGDTLCFQWMSACPNDVPKPRRRYSLRNVRDKNGEWRLEVGEARFSDAGMTLPLEVAVNEGMVQVVSGEGPWAVDLKRIPAVETKAGEGKKWKLGIALTTGATNEGCWVEVQCPGSGG